MTIKTDEMRKRYEYRRLILEGTVKVPRTAAVRLIGPDCAFHLYGISRFARRKKSDLKALGKRMKGCGPDGNP